MAIHFIVLLNFCYGTEADKEQQNIDAEEGNKLIMGDELEKNLESA